MSKATHAAGLFSALADGAVLFKGTEIGRNLLQSADNLVIDDGNVGRFARLVSNAERGTTVELSVDVVPLDAVMNISARGVQLIGVNARATRIRCSGEGRIEIRATGVDLVNLVVENCVGGAVTLVNDDAVFDPFDIDAEYDFQALRVNFTRVRFLNNELDPEARRDTGGALGVGPGTLAVVEECIFRGNKATVGGAILVDGAGSLEMEDTVLEDNEATIAGGAVAAGFTENFFGTTETISIKKCTFLRNRDVSGGEDATGLTLGNGAPLENSVFLRFPSPSPSGGAIFVQGYSDVLIDRTMFDGNTAIPAGGAIYISDNDVVTVVNCTFDNNAVTSIEAQQGSGVTDRVPDLELGGAIYLAFTNVISQATIDRCVFRNNSASYGGVIHAVTELATMLAIENCQFEDNFAELAGGAVIVRNTIQARFRNVRFFRNRATAGGGVMFTNGAGGVFFEGPFPGIDLDVYFTENQAFDGGAVFLLGAGQVVFQGARFNRNRAARNGGAVCLIASLPSGQTSIQANFFHSNSARRGGAIFMDGASKLEMFTVDENINQFIRNKALAGGALHIRPSSQVINVIKISDAEFKKNEAVQTPRDAEIHRLDLPDVEVETTALGRRLLFHRTLLQAPKDDGGSEPVLLDAGSIDACHPGGGGALCLLTALVPERAPIEISITNVDMVENVARVGGAIFAATSRSEDWIASCESDGSAFESLTARPCKSFSISQTLLQSNEAKSAGGGVFVSHPETVYVDTSGNGDFVKLSTISTKASLFDKNVVGKKGFGDNIATNAATMRIKRPIPEGDLLIVGHNSGEELPEIALELLDVFEQIVKDGISDSAMSISINSSIVSGQRVAQADGGRILFSKVVALGKPIEHPVVFVPNSERTESVRSRFSIRQCIVGESRIDDKNICDVCDREYFGFNYSFTCDGCPDNARCSGAASLVPIKGYWHSTPFSPIMHECILEDACSYPRRRATLAAFYDQIPLIPSNETLSEEDYHQCADEYVGPLCGSCVKGYGHVIDGECVECRQVWLTAILIVLVCCWTLFLLVSTARGAFDTIREMNDMRMVRVLTMSASRGSTSKKSSNRSSQRSRPTSQDSRDEGGKKSVGFQEVIDDVNEVVPDGAQEGGSGNGPARFASRSGDENVDHIMAAEKVSETIKILTNFFQITAVGVGINASWTESIRFLLVVEDSVASVSSGASFAPMECLFENLEDRTIIGIVLRTLFPLALTVLYVVSNAWKHRKDTYVNIKRRFVIGLIVGIFFAYDTVTEMLMRLVNCITLDNPNPEDPEAPLVIQRYAIYATARDEYWAEDTQHVCWHGSHGVAAGLLGIPGLVIISFGIPFFLALFLLYYRHRGLVLEPEFLNTYGFVYQSYQPRFVFWESIIMLRKASMAAVIVYAYDLGPNLQSAIALGILIFSLLAQFLAHPFKYTSLNILESLSLLASIFIFYSGVVFRDPNTSYAGKVILSVIIICTNLLMVCLFIHRLFTAYDHLIVVKLRLEKVEWIPETAIERAKLLSKVNATKLKASIQEKLKLANRRKGNNNGADPLPSQEESP